MKALYVESDMIFRYIDVMCDGGGLTEDSILDARRVADAHLDDEAGDWQFWEAELPDEFSICVCYIGG